MQYDNLDPGSYSGLPFPLPTTARALLFIARRTQHFLPSSIRVDLYLPTLLGVKIRPRKACNYPNLRSFGWVSYDKIDVLYSGKLGNRSEARASDLKSYPGLWWNRIKLRLYDGKESEYSARTCSIGRPAGGTLCPHL